VTGQLAIDTPVGTLVLEGRADALTKLRLPGAYAAPPAQTRAPKAVADAARQLDEYFGGRRTSFEVPLAVEGTAFQRAVWAELAEIPYGSTITYAELAARVGRPRACRAAGTANGANPIPIILPCHRVIATGGGLGGYGGGLEMKRALLDLELASG
jgi:methylated-DNA-[protein]-cysteine S-methyltransferase